MESYYRIVEVLDSWPLNAILNIGLFSLLPSTPPDLRHSLCHIEYELYRI